MEGQRCVLKAEPGPLINCVIPETAQGVDSNETGTVEMADKKKAHRSL